MPAGSRALEWARRPATLSLGACRAWSQSNTFVRFGGPFRALGTSLKSASLVVMRWALLSFGLLGAILYVTGTFTPPPEEPSGSSESAALVWPDDAQLDTRPGLPTHAIDPSAPSPQEATPSITRQAQPATSQTSETQEPLLNDPPRQSPHCHRITPSSIHGVSSCAALRYIAARLYRQPFSATPQPARKCSSSSGI